MPKEIEVAKFAGFCYGVKRAVETVKKIKEDNPDTDVYVLGELIHNTQVIDELSYLGVYSVEEVPQDKSGICVVRTHGQSPVVIEQIRNSGMDICDLTCPDVKKVQQKAIELVKEGYILIIIGKEEHPEVSAIKANAMEYSDKVMVADSVEQIKPYEQGLRKYGKIGVVVQTTQTVEVFEQIVEYLKKISKDLKVENTICPSTSRRQNEAYEVAKRNDLMIVAGSKKSANTTHLAQICSHITKTIHIESAKELDNYKNLIDGAYKIGITAGASTPQSVIDEVVEELRKR